MGDNNTSVEEEDRKPLLSPVKEAQESGTKDESTLLSLASPSTVAASLAILILGLLFRTGWLNVLLVLLCSM